MADFKEQTNSLMVRVIPIYLSAELLCPNLFWEGGGDQWKPGEESSRAGAGCIRHVEQACEECAQRGLFDRRPV